MQLIIIEGTDNTGKDTLIKSLMEYFPMVTYKHFQKPPKNVDPLEWQTVYFKNFFRLMIIRAQQTCNEDDVVILNRSYQGEYVYGQLYRNEDPNEILKMTNYIDDLLIRYTKLMNPVYITLLSNSNKIISENEDGESMSKGDIERISKERELFTQIHDKSKLNNKHIIYVNEGDKFRSKKDIYNEAMSYIRPEYFAKNLMSVK